MPSSSVMGHIHMTLTIPLDKVNKEKKLIEFEASLWGMDDRLSYMEGVITEHKMSKNGYCTWWIDHWKDK